jgi:DNA-binding NarL/FixJ family response regulator
VRRLSLCDSHHVSRLLMKLDLDNRVQIALLVHDAGPTRQ